MSYLDIHIGQQVRRRRITLGLSQKALADGLGITFQQIQKYEKGANTVNARRLHELSKTLGIPVAYFFEGLRSGATAGKEAAEPVAIGHDDWVASERETIEMIKAFTRIRDRRLRHCMAQMMRHLTDAGGGKDSGKNRQKRMANGK